MQQFMTLVKMEFFNRRKIMENRSKFLQVLYFLSRILIIALFVAVIAVVFSFIIKLFINADLENEFLIFFIGIFQVCMLIFALFQLVKILRSTGETKEVLTFPISPVKMFFSKVTYCYISQLVASVLILLPVFLCFAILSAQSAYFYIALLPCLVLIPSIPFCFALLLSVPLMRLINYMERSPILVLIIYALLLIGFFYGYIEILKFLLQLFQSNSSASIISVDMATTMREFGSKLYLPVLFKNILIKSYAFRSSLVVLNLALLSGLLLYVFAKKMYLNILRSTLLIEQKVLTLDKKVKNQSVFVSLIKKDFKAIIRSTNYSFSYLATTFTTPIMVFFCNAVVSDIGLEMTGQTIFPALTYFVLLIFMVVGTSFSATTITREGKSFAVTKTIPVKPLVQVKSKLFIYLVVSIPVAIISCLVLYVANYINLLDFLIISISVALFNFASICFAINKDIKSPKFNYLTNNEVVQNNSNISLYVGVQLTLALVLGLASIVMVYVWPKYIWYFLIVGISAIYLIINFFMLFKNLDKKYHNIEI